MTTQKILIVEDEMKIAQLLADYLTQSTFASEIVNRGDQVLAWLDNNPCDLILLDLMLPGLDGFEVCKAIRKKSEIPIIMLTAKVEEIDRLIGLEIGADDYICKPFSPREVVARVKAVLRRINKNTSIDEYNIMLDEGAFKISFNQKTCELTKVEFGLFQSLYKRPGQIFSRDQLMNSIYDDQHIVSDRTIDSHIKKIRKKLEVIGLTENTIQSVYGAGYKFE